MDWFIPTVSAKWAAILLALLSYMVAEFSSAEHKYFVKPDGCNISCPREACCELAFYTEHKFVVKSNNVFSCLEHCNFFLLILPNHAICSKPPNQLQNSSRVTQNCMYWNNYWRTEHP